LRWDIVKVCYIFCYVPQQHTQCHLRLCTLALLCVSQKIECLHSLTHEPPLNSAQLRSFYVGYDRHRNVTRRFLTCHLDAALSSPSHMCVLPSARMLVLVF
jgi:hypothetical protein